MVANRYPNSNDNQPPISLLHIVTIVFKHKWIIISFFFGIVSVVTLGSLRTTETFEARSKFIIEKDVDTILPDNNKASYDKFDLIASEIEIIKSDPVASNVVEMLGLHKRKIPADQDVAIDPELIKAKMMRTLQQKIRLDVAKNSNVVEISYRNQYRYLARDVVKSVISEYKKWRSKLYDQSEREISLKDRLDVTTKKIQEYERAQLVFKKNNDLSSPEERKKILTQKLSGVEHRLTEIGEERWRKAANLRAIKKHWKEGVAIPTITIESSDSPFQSTLVKKWRGELADLELEHELALQNYTQDSPNIIKLESQIALLDEKIDGEITRLIEWEEMKLQSLIHREAELRLSLERFKKERSDLAQKEFEYTQMSRGLEDQRDIYSVLLKQYEEARMLRNKLRGVNVRVIDFATLPNDPVNPRTRLKITIAVILGLVCGLGLAFFREYFDHTFTFPDEIERYADLAILGSIREFDKVKSHNGDRPRLKARGEKYKIDKVLNLKINQV